MTFLWLFVASLVTGLILGVAAKMRPAQTLAVASAMCGVALALYGLVSLL